MLQVEHAVQGPPAGSSGHKVPYLDVANTWSAAQVIDIGANLGTALTLRSSEPGASFAPSLDIFRDSASPAVSDVLGAVRFLGRSSANVQRSYGSFYAAIVDPTDGAEFSTLSISNISNGIGNGFSIGQGLYSIGAGFSTGGDKGLGTGNFIALYEVGVALTAKYGQLAVANAWAAQQTITVTASGAIALALISTNPDNVQGPILDTFRDSASPAANDNLAQLRFQGRDSANAQVVYGGIQSLIVSPTSGSSSGVIAFQTRVANANGSRFYLGQGIYTAAATGGDKGADTINATALYEAGVALTAKYLALTGGTLTGVLTISAAGTQLTMNKAASGQNNLIGGYTAGSPRWLIIPGDSTAEAAGNVGSNLSIYRYDNSGTFIDSPFSITRSSGQVSVGPGGFYSGGTISINIPSGGAYLSMNSSAGQQDSVNMSSNGVAKWQFGKQTDDSIFLYDSAAATYVFTAPSNGTTISFGKSALLPANSTAVTAAAGDSTTKIATTAFVSTAITNASGFANIMRRNGGLEIWQRGAGGAASFAFAASMSTQVYTADGWYTFNGAGEAMVISQVAGLVNGSQSAAKVQRNAGQTGTANIYFNFPLDTDEIYPCLGQFLLLSFTAKAGANYSQASGGLFVQIVVGTGTPARYIGTGYPSGGAFALNSGVNLTTTPQRFGLVIPAIIPVTTRQMDINFVFAPAGTAGADDSFTIDDVQLEIVPAATGYVPSNFQRLIFEEQLLLCQRHFFKTFNYAVAPAQNAGTGIGDFVWQDAAAGAVATAGQLRFPVLMRATPSITTFNPSAVNAQARNIPAAADCSGLAATGLSTATVLFTAAQPAAAVVGGYNGIHVTADSGI